MKSIAKSITAILLSLFVLCAFAACENDKVNDNSENQSSTAASTASEKSNAPEESSAIPDANGTKKLLYKLHSQIGEEAEATTTYEYTEFGEITTETKLEQRDTLPVTTKYEYNENKKLISVTTYYAETETGKIKYEYNDSGLLAKEIFENAIGTRENVYVYDKDERLISVKTTDGAEAKYTYNVDGSYTIDKFLSDGSKNGQEIYNKNGLLAEDKSEDGSKMVYTHNDKGNIISFESYDSSGKLTAKEIYTYDGQTAVKKCYDQDKLVAILKYYYDEDDNLIRIAEIDESGNETVKEEREYKLFDIVK